jgi:hypothetical protein
MISRFAGTGHYYYRQSRICDSRFLFHLNLLEDAVAGMSEQAQTNGAQVYHPMR